MLAESDSGTGHLPDPTRGNQCDLLGPVSERSIPDSETLRVYAPEYIRICRNWLEKSHYRGSGRLRIFQPSRSELRQRSDLVCGHLGSIGKPPARNRNTPDGRSD